MNSSILHCPYYTLYAYVLTNIISKKLRCVKQAITKVILGFLYLAIVNDDDILL